MPEASPSPAAARAATVSSVNRDDEHRFSKPQHDEIVLIAGLGVEGDSHLGPLVQHRAHRRTDPDRPNLRQVHLIHSEVFGELAAAGYTVGPGDMGENITTSGIDLAALSRGTRVHLGSDAVVELTGMRDPCELLNGLAPSLMKQLLLRDPDGTIVRKAGVMSIVVRGGVVKPGDGIRVEAPDEHVPLQPV